MGCYKAVWGATGQYGVPQGSMGCYRAVRGATGQYGAALGFMATS